jgi:Zn-dependent protease with chaperone function
MIETCSSAFFFDGKTAARQSVRIRLAETSLEIARDTSPVLIQWEFHSLRLIDDGAEDGTLRLGSVAAPDARIVTDDLAFLSALRQAAPHLFVPPVRRLVTQRKATILAVMAVLLVTILYFATTSFTQTIVWLVPAEWQSALGDTLRDRLFGEKRRCQSPSGTAALGTLKSAVAGRREELADVSILVLDAPTINAFALPGRQIVVLRGLLDDAKSADELAGVLAHEMGHVAHHHPMEAIIRLTGLTVLSAVLTGDSASVADRLVEIGGVLYFLSYRRGQETVADHNAHDLLNETGIGSAGMARFFGRRSRKDRPKGDWIEAIEAYASTHPAADARGARPTTMGRAQDNLC